MEGAVDKGALVGAFIFLQIFLLLFLELSINPKRNVYDVISPMTDLLVSFKNGAAERREAG